MVMAVEKCDTCLPIITHDNSIVNHLTCVKALVGSVSLNTEKRNKLRHIPALGRFSTATKQDTKKLFDITFMGVTFESDSSKARPISFGVPGNWEFCQLESRV
jgi:hypothetical protein